MSLLPIAQVPHGWAEHLGTGGKPIFYDTYLLFKQCLPALPQSDYSLILVLALSVGLDQAWGCSLGSTTGSVQLQAPQNILALLLIDSKAKSARRRKGQDCLSGKQDLRAIMPGVVQHFDPGLPSQQSIHPFLILVVSRSFFTYGERV